MNTGQVLGFVWTVAVWLFLIVWFVAPVSFAVWRAREKRDQRATEDALARTRPYRGDEHWWDA